MIIIKVLVQNASSRIEDLNSGHRFNSYDDKAYAKSALA